MKRNILLLLLSVLLCVSVIFSVGCDTSSQSKLATLPEEEVSQVSSQLTNS